MLAFLGDCQSPKDCSERPRTQNEARILLTVASLQSAASSVALLDLAKSLDIEVASFIVWIVMKQLASQGPVPT